MKSIPMSAIAVMAALLWAAPVLAAGDNANVERRADRVIKKEAKDDNKAKKNPCKSINENSTRKARKACEVFLQQQ